MLGKVTPFAVAEAIYCRALGANDKFDGRQQFVRLSCPLTAPCHENLEVHQLTRVFSGQPKSRNIRNIRRNSDIQWFLNIFDDSWSNLNPKCFSNGFSFLRAWAWVIIYPHMLQNSWLDGHRWTLGGGLQFLLPFPVALSIPASYKLRQWAANRPTLQEFAFMTWQPVKA